MTFSIEHRIRSIERRGLRVELYNRGARQVQHAGCPVVWDMIPIVEFAKHTHNPIRGKMTIMPRIPEDAKPAL